MTRTLIQDFVHTDLLYKPGKLSLSILIFNIVGSSDGPDAPQLTKTSSECVGGGDATVGQTVRLTCTSTSLPPASFSWALNGQPVTAGQSGSGVLSLQIFSTNQSGTYTCSARNDITGGASKQQIDLAIVGELMALCGITVTDASVSSFFGLRFIFLTGEGVINYRIDKFMCHYTGRSHNFHPPTMHFLCRILSPIR